MNAERYNVTTTPFRHDFRHDDAEHLEIGSVDAISLSRRVLLSFQLPNLQRRHDESHDGTGLSGASSPISASSASS